MKFTIGTYDIEIHSRARRKWSEFHSFRAKESSYKHWVWGRLSLSIEDWSLEDYAICAVCESTELTTLGRGDEGWDFCPDCRSIEGGVKYLNKRDFYNLK